MNGLSFSDLNVLYYVPHKTKLAKTWSCENGFASSDLNVMYALCGTQSQDTEQARKLQATLVLVRNYHRLADGGEV